MKRLFLERDNIKTEEDVAEAYEAFIDSIPLWEDSFSRLLILCGLIKSADDNYVATEMNDKMFKKKIINEYEHRIIEKMCYRISFFINDLENQEEDISLEETRDLIGGSYYIYNESSEIVSRKIKELDPSFEDTIEEETVGEEVAKA